MASKFKKICILDQPGPLLDTLAKVIGIRFQVEKISAFEPWCLDSDGVVFNCGSMFDVSGVLEGFYGLFPFFENRYLGNIILFSDKNSVTQDGRFERLFDRRITFFRHPLLLPHLLSKLLSQPTREDVSKRLACCAAIKRYFPLANFQTALNRLKDWYDEDRMVRLIDDVGQYHSFSQLEHDLADLAPWINELKRCFVRPLPLLPEIIPKNLGVLVIDDERQWYDEIKTVVGRISNNKWMIDWAKNRGEAISKLTAYFRGCGEFFPIDVILLDMHFGNRTEEGIRILEEIRAISHNIPVIVLTVQFGTSPKIIDCLEKGANFYATKMELDNLPAYIVRVMQTASRPKINDQTPTISLSADEEYLLRHLFRESRDLVVKNNLDEKKSLSGKKKIIRVKRYATLDGKLTEQAPVIVKIGPHERLAKEYNNFKKYVERYLPFQAAKIERFLSHKKLAILSYVKVSGAGDDLELCRVTSLNDGLDDLRNHGKVNKVLDSLKRFIKNDIGPAWYEKAVLPDPRHGRVFDFYVHKMPIVLSLSPAPKSYDAHILSSVSDLAKVKPGQVVAVQGYPYKDKGRMFISILDSRFKIHVKRTLAETLCINDKRPVTVTGEVRDTLCSMLKTEWREAVGSTQTEHWENQTALDIIEKINPIAHIWNVLYMPLDGKESIIHGDFHMDNLFFDWDRKIGWLIDFGSTGYGHVCFDFIRLEVDIRTRTISRYFYDIGGDLNDMFVFERSLYPFSCPLMVKDEQMWHKLDRMRKIISQIRILAHRYLNQKDSWHEYFQGLFCYSLNTFKFKYEKRNYYPFSRFLPMVCATTALSYLKQSMPGTCIKAVIIDLWNTLLSGQGNPLSNFLKDKLSSTDFDIIRKILLTRHLNEKQCLDLVQKYLPHFTRKELENLISGVMVDLKPGAADLIKNLHRSGIKLCILSNDWALEHSVVINKLKSENLWGCFSVKLFSFKEGVAKPESGIFMKALEKLGFAPSEVFMVGDSYESDMIPAKKLGINTFQITANTGLDDFWDTLRSGNGFL